MNVMNNRDKGWTVIIHVVRKAKTLNPRTLGEWEELTQLTNSETIHVADHSIRHLGAAILTPCVRMRLDCRT